MRGLGLPVLEGRGVLDALHAASASKDKGEKGAFAREGALFAYEALADALGRLFEPYILDVVPQLLACVADGSGGVRAAAVAASQTIMGRLSSQGAKLVLPALLDALDSEKWRTKHAAVELLGAMAYCAPTQLASTLPRVVPALTEVLAHPHPRVKEKAQESLSLVGSVIRNPEVGELVPVLLDALANPGTKTVAALDALARCNFEHCVDPPSLALLVPIMLRGLRERGTQPRRRAAHIVGSMCSLLADRRHIVPYLEALLPPLRDVLLDPIPEVRTTASRALGRLCAGLGEGHFPDLMPWLLTALRSESSNAERAGAAQGLAELLAALGERRLGEFLPELLDGSAVASSPAAREGHALLWLHLARAAGAAFEPHMPEVLPALLRALDDDYESVRSAAMASAREMISIYTDAATRLLLPSLQAGLLLPSHRMRIVSIELLGELMERMTGGEPLSLEHGSSGGGHGEPDEALAGVPAELQHSLLASLYVARCDTEQEVRQAAAAVWKALVTNTPRALRIVMPTLTSILVDMLSSDDEDMVEAGTSALIELVAKLGEKALGMLVPSFQKRLAEGTGSVRERAAACIGLAEVVAAASRDSVQRYVDGLVNAIRTGLCDEDAGVVSAAARAFGSLQREIGPAAVSAVVPPMLAMLSSHDELEVEAGRRALRELVSQRPQAVAPYLLPLLCAGGGLTLPYARALDAIAGAAGAALHPMLDVVIPALLSGLYVERELIPLGANDGGDGDGDASELRDALLAAASFRVPRRARRWTSHAL